MMMSQTLNSSGRLSQASFTSSFYSEDEYSSRASSFVEALEIPESIDVDYSPISSSASSFVEKPERKATAKATAATTTTSTAPPFSFLQPPPIPTQPKSVHYTRYSASPSLQSLRSLTPDELRKELGYLPFEYWKGPKPVIPPSAQRQQQQRSQNWLPPRPSTASRLATVGVAFAHPIRTAQQRHNKKRPVTPKYTNRGRTGKEAYTQIDDTASAYLGWVPQKMSSASSTLRTKGGEVELTYSAHSRSSSRSQHVGVGPSSLPPRSRNMGYNREPWWNARYWRKRTWAIVVAVLVAIIVAATVAGVLVSRANRYPDYSQLNYELKDIYYGESFFDNFNYFEGYDPAQGFVHYVPKETAKSLNLTYATSKRAILRVDTSVGPRSTPDASTGRFSVRVSSKKQYEKGLFIFDVKHTPYGCGTWPALWLVDETDWPANGEIDIMEAVNKATEGNQMTLHTSDGCDMGGVKRQMTGSSLQGDCHNTTNDNAGCGVRGDSPATFGQGFNAAGGGIMAMEWREEGIRMWQFARNAIPGDILNRKPDPSAWGTAAADFPNTECGMTSHFRNQSIVANIDLCGQYAGGAYASSGCPSNCTDFVARNPAAFANAYWEFGSWEVYQAT